MSADYDAFMLSVVQPVREDNDRLHTELEDLRTQHADLRTQYADLRAHNARLLQRNAELDAKQPADVASDVEGSAAHHQRAESAYAILSACITELEDQIEDVKCSCSERQHMSDHKYQGQFDVVRASIQAGLAAAKVQTFITQVTVRNPNKPDGGFTHIQVHPVTTTVLRMLQDTDIAFPSGIIFNNECCHYFEKGQVTDFQQTLQQLGMVSDYHNSYLVIVDDPINKLADSD